MHLTYVQEIVCVIVTVVDFFYYGSLRYLLAESEHVQKLLKNNILKLLQTS